MSGDGAGFGLGSARPRTDPASAGAGAGAGAGPGGAPGPGADVDPRADFDPAEAQRLQDAAAAELPALLAASRAEGADVAERRAFWSAILHLPHWIFIARGESANPSPFVVYAGPQGDIPTVLVFSSAESALAVGRAAGLSAEEASLLLAVPLPQAIDWVASLAAAGVSMAQFEAQDDGGLVMPVHLMPAMRDDLLGPAQTGDPSA